MFVSSEPFVLFDYFRIPYRVANEQRKGGKEGLRDGFAWVERDGASDAALYYWKPRSGRSARSLSWNGSPIFSPVLDLESSRARLAAVEGSWEQETEATIVDERGVAASAVWRDDRGNAFLPFDPNRAIEAYWQESYAERTHARIPSPKKVAMHAYYRLRPALPRGVQIAMRRGFSRIQARTRFPRWPVETALHDLYDALLGLVASVAGEAVPFLAPWPAGKTWVLSLTHDVETARGYEQIGLMRDLEQRLGYRSSWNLVPRRYEIDPATVTALQDAGFEVGVHGLYHDGRDLESERMVRERLPAIRDYASRWDAVGFRSPATHRDWNLMPLLGFDYDSSSPDTDPFEPQAGGCCSWWPFHNGELVELPITLVQDHTLFVILRRDDEQLWIDKTELLREKHGMALLITHPDYMLGERRLSSYRRFLERYATDGDVWRALPREISSWWRRRASSTIVRGESGWSVAGAAAGDAVVMLRHP